MTGDWTSAKNSTNQTIISVQSKFFFLQKLFLRDIWSKDDIICVLYGARHMIMTFS